MIEQTLYPRPDFDRSHHWVSLNGEWEFAPDPHDVGCAEGWEQAGRGSWQQHIAVPYPWEWPLSGVEQEWLPVGWYRRTVQRPADWDGQRVILNVGAAHYACQAWLNGHYLGMHEGGYLPFSFDVTDTLEDGQGVVVFRIEAPLDKRFIPHGKQRSRPVDDYDGCSFTASSGIWQPVWLECRPATYIERLDLRPTDDLAGIQVGVRVAGPRAASASLELSFEDGDPIRISVHNGVADTVLHVDNPIQWSPSRPHLYSISAVLTSDDGVDRVSSYAGLRRIETVGSHLYLNGERLYLRGVLDQGFWPKSGHAAPDGDALRRDVELTLAAGYNLARKHIKFEDPRWLYWADRLGLLVWAEPPCTGRYSEEAVALYESQLAPWVARDGNHPSIVMWGLYNEEWGLDWLVGEDPVRQQAVARAYDLLAALDHSRPILDNSGWWHVKSDVLDWHYYDNDVQRWNELTANLAGNRETWFGHQIGPDREYQTQLCVPGTSPVGLPLMNGEYGGGNTERERGWHLRWQTQELRRHDSLSGYIYTELTDVEHELCGIYTFDRQPRDLGCDPAIVNADTVLIFDLVPGEPGCDLTVSGDHICVDMHVAHQGSEPIDGELCWGWGTPGQPVGQLPLSVEPHRLTPPFTVQASLPDGKAHDRLYVWLVDEGGRQRAGGFLDITVAEGEGGAAGSNAG